ncbi:MAG: DUF3426 domain-containing protein, partial [Gammaproteobacteria bacterium]
HMYTRCPQCSTVFRVTAAQLRTALGDVSCGTCHTTFNALNALSDDLPELTELVVLEPLETQARATTAASETSDESAATPDIEGSDREYVDAGDDAQDDDEAGFDDNLVATVVDEPVETELPGESGGTDSEAEIEVEAGDEAEIESEAEDEYEAEIKSEAGQTPQDTPGDEASEGLADIDAVVPDAQGQETPAASGDRPPDDGNAADAWSRILADVDQDDRAADRRELEAEALATDDMTDTREPAYDDNTGYEEILTDADIDTPPDEVTSDVPPEEDDPLEFNAPEQTWSEIFVPPDWQPPTSAIPDPDPDPDDDDRPGEPASESPLESVTDDPEEWQTFLSEVTQVERPPDDFEPDDGGEEGPVVVVGAREEMPVDQPSAQSDPLIDYEPEFIPPWESETGARADSDEQHPRPPYRRIAIAAALIVALGVQLVHYNRDSLAADPSWGPRVRGVYSALGGKLYPDWNLDAYRVSGSEAVAGRTASTALDIMANVVITGDEDVGMPMIRVALRDRWANPVASRVFSPPEYLPDFIDWPTLISPGTTLPVEISVADPGADAHGYEVDVCLPRRDSGLQCQLASDPFQR